MLSVASTEYDYSNGAITNTERKYNQITNGLSSIPLYGTALSVGMFLGDKFGPMNGEIWK